MSGSSYFFFVFWNINGQNQKTQEIFNQIGGAAWLAPPRSYRSIRANLAIPLRMALKTRSRGRNWDVRPATCYVRQCWITQLSKVRWIFGGWRLCPWIFFAPTVACRFAFFGREQNSIPWRRAPQKIPGERNSRRYGSFFVLIFLLLDGMLKSKSGQTARIRDLSKKI